MERRKLDTLIEREVYKLISNIKNHSDSFMHLATRKRGITVDPKLLEALIHIMGLAIEDGFQSQVDIFNQGIGKALDQYTGEENFTHPTSSRKKTKE